MVEDSEKKTGNDPFDFDVILTDDVPEDKFTVKDATPEKDEVTEIFDQLVGDIQNIKKKHEIEIIHDIRVVEPPKTTIQSAGNVSTLKDLDPAFQSSASADQFTNPVLENALVIVLDGYIEIIRHDAGIPPRIINSLMELRDIIMRKDKRLAYQKYDELADDVAATKQNELKAMLFVIHAIYFAKISVY